MMCGTLSQRSDAPHDKVTFQSTEMDINIYEPLSFIEGFNTLKKHIALRSVDQAARP